MYISLQYNEVKMIIVETCNDNNDILGCEMCHENAINTDEMTYGPAGVMC